MKTKIFIASFLFFPLMLFSFDMILTGDPIIDDIRFISLETGKPFLSFSPPLAPAEVQIFVQRFIDLIDEQTLSHPARQAFYRVQKRLSPVSRISYSDDIFSLLMDINAAFEGKARFNSNISWYPRYPEITPFIALPLRISFADTVQIYVEPILAINRRAHLRGNATINIPFDYADVSHNLALRAFAAAGGNWWNFQIGRDRLYWGTGRTGSLTFSDNSQYFDFARISFFSSRVKYSMTINQLPLRLRRDLFEEGRFQPEWWQDQNNTNLVLNRYYYLHRLDIRLSNRLTIGLMEGIMTGNSQLQIRYLTPMVFHDLFAWNDYPRWEGKGDMVGSIASIELNWHITNNLAS
ncbi:MAG: capsule assembly Wzi family protein, partial [Treponema sp.]|nr:capsule assembly Wzi family protein [Treponema sp.]